MDKSGDFNAATDLVAAAGEIVPVNLPGAMPPRRFTPMAKGAVVAWTPSRLLAAAAAWLMEETPVTPRAVRIGIDDRRA